MSTAATAGLRSDMQNLLFGSGVMFHSGHSSLVCVLKETNVPTVTDHDLNKVEI